MTIPAHIAAHLEEARKAQTQWMLPTHRSETTMASEWTQEELIVAAGQVYDLNPKPEWDKEAWVREAVRPGLSPVSMLLIELACQRNRALAALVCIRFICSNAGHAPCRCGGIDEEGNVCPNACNCDWAKEIIPIIDAAIAACKKGDA